MHSTHFQCISQGFYACVLFAIPSVTRVARVRCISLAERCASLREIVASRYSRARERVREGKACKLYKLDEIFRRAAPVAELLFRYE